MLTITLASLVRALRGSDRPGRCNEKLCWSTKLSLAISMRRNSLDGDYKNSALSPLFEPLCRISTPSLCLPGLTLSNGPRPQLRLIHRIGVRPRTSSQIPRRVLFLRLRAGVVQW